MPLTTITQSYVNPGTAIWLKENDQDLLVPTGFSVVTTALSLTPTVSVRAILMSGSEHDAEIRGSVIGGTGVQIGDSNLDYGNALTVTATGSVFGVQAGALIFGSSEVTNAGQIRATQTALELRITGDDAATVTNDGLVAGANGVWFQGLSGTTGTLTNRGHIEGSLAAVAGDLGAENVVNRGVLAGNVSLGGGNDRFDNREGTLMGGKAVGGAGNDSFLLGAGAETVVGGEGFDTLDFRSGAGLRVSLYDSSGTGRAAGDTYTGIERILGSSTGNDILLGNGANTTLVGGGGHDTLFDGAGADRLEGGEGNDSLAGAAGVDSLYGGLGDDTFVLVPWAGASDRIFDWGAVAGDNDRFLIDASTFGGGLVAGESLGTKFVSLASSNLAQEAVDRFVFRQSDATLWFDRDGKGGDAGVMIADLQDGAVVTALDFLLVA